jgi:hypothetical protein
MDEQYSHPRGGEPRIRSVGISVWILPNATEETRHAASALLSTLNDALLSGVVFTDKGNTLHGLNPGTIFDERTVLIVVGEHPIPLAPPHVVKGKSNTQSK